MPKKRPIWGAKAKPASLPDLKDRAKDERQAMAVLRAFWHRGRKTFVRLTSDEVDARSAAPARFRKALVEHGLIVYSPPGVYDITTEGVTRLKAAGLP